MKNSSKARQKISRNEKMLNRQIINIFILQISICLFASIYGTLWERENNHPTYPYLQIELNHKSHWSKSLKWIMIRFGSWILMFTYFIPISLVITIEIVRLIQGFFISWDLDVYDQEKDIEAKVQSSNLNEELGQVSYLFSDKTGTLT